MRQPKREGIILHLCCWESEGQEAGHQSLFSTLLHCLTQGEHKNLYVPQRFAAYCTYWERRNNPGHFVCAVLTTSYTHQEAESPQQLSPAEQPQLHSLLQSANVQVYIKFSSFQNLMKIVWMLTKFRLKYSALFRDQKTLFLYSTLYHSRVRCSILLLFSCAITAVTSVSSLCKLNIPAHLFHYPSKLKHQSKYDLRSGWVYSGLDEKYCKGCNEIQYFPHSSLPS